MVAQDFTLRMGVAIIMLCINVVVFVFILCRAGIFMMLFVYAKLLSLKIYLIWINMIILLHFV